MYCLNLFLQPWWHSIVYSNLYYRYPVSIYHNVLDSCSVLSTTSLFYATRFFDLGFLDSRAYTRLVLAVFRTK